MTTFNKEEKIKRLKTLLYLNFKHNFLRSFHNKYSPGLCFLYQRHYTLEVAVLYDDVPELIEFAYFKDSTGYWWPSNQFVLNWWYRHRAISRTIIKLKNNEK
jgi:hypothetical protein